MQILNSNKKEIGQSVVKGSIILIIANLLVKIIGALFKIPLANLLGNEGMGYFSSAYAIYSGLFVVATAGLPVAIAKMVAESTAHNNLRELKRIHRVSYAIFALVGVIGTAVLYFGADKLLKGYGDNAICVQIVAPAIFFVSIMSVYRGFFQGLSDMYPTAFSELIESGAKLVFGMMLAYIFLKDGLIYGAAGAISGVTVGSILGAIFLISVYLFKRKNIYSRFDSTKKAPPVKEVVFKLLYVALPVTISASVFTITNLIDVAQIGSRLSLIADKIPKEQIEKCMEYASDAITGVADSATSAIVNSLYGMYQAKVVTMLNLIPAIVVAVCLPLVPAIARAYESKKMTSVSMATNRSVKFTIVFALPGAVGIGVLSDPILVTLFGSNDASFILKLITPAIVTVSLVLVTNAILQATGHVLVPVINIAVAGITKVIINYFLLVIPEINISGVAVGTSACYTVYMILNLIYVVKITKPNLKFLDCVIKPGIAALIMGVSVWAINRVLTGFMDYTRFESVVRTAVSVVVGVLVYVPVLFKLNMLSEDEISELPKGDKLILVLKKIKLL